MPHWGPGDVWRQRGLRAPPAPVCPGRWGLLSGVSFSPLGGVPGTLGSLLPGLAFYISQQVAEGRTSREGPEEPQAPESRQSGPQRCGEPVGSTRPPAAVSTPAQAQGAQTPRLPQHDPLPEAQMSPGDRLGGSIGPCPQAGPPSSTQVGVWAALCWAGQLGVGEDGSSLPWSLGALEGAGEGQTPVKTPPPRVLSG